MSVHYDALAINRNMALDLPFREGVGTITHSLARTKPLVTIVPNAAPWSILDSNLPFITLDGGGTEYLWASAADTPLLNFTSQDYSVGCWFRIDSGGEDDKTLMSRFLVSNTGWEMYHYTSLTLQMRHHHLSQAPALRSSAYSHGWAYGKWWFMGFSRIGAVGQFYRGDIDGFEGALATICNGGLIDPDTCAVNLNIGRSPANENYWKGGLWRPRAWFDRALTEAEWQQIWEKEVEWFRS